MSNYTTLKTTINANIRQNGNQEITGKILNSVLNAMVNTLGEGYQFAGIATTKIDPGTSDAKVFYIAKGKGTYTNFGGLEVTEDEVVFLVWDKAWHKVATGIAADAKLKEAVTELTEIAGKVENKQDIIPDLEAIREGAEKGNVAFSAIASIVKAGYVFAGIATPSTDPGTPDAKVFYIANGKGEYTKFGGLEVTEDEVVVLCWDSLWNKVSTGIASDQKLSELDLRIGYEKSESSYDNEYLKSIDVNNWFAGILGTINTNQKSIIVPLANQGTIELTGNPDNASYYCLLSAIPSSLANEAVVDTYSDGFTKALALSPGTVTKISYTEESKILLLFYNATDATYCRLPSMVSIDRSASGINKEIESIKQDYEAKPRYFDGDYREEAEAFIEEINVFSNFTKDDELMIASYGTHTSGKLYITLVRKSSITSTVAIASASSLNKGEWVLMPIITGSTFNALVTGKTIGYIIARRDKFPNTGLSNRNLSILDTCFNGNSKSIMSNCQFLLNAGYSPIIDLLKSFYVDKTISRECDSTAFSIRPALSIPNYDDRIIVAGNIEDYELRDGSESDEVLVKAFAPYIYFKMKKIGTFVLFDEDGRAFYYDKVGNKKYIVTE